MSPMVPLSSASLVPVHCASARPSAAMSCTSSSSSHVSAAPDAPADPQSSAVHSDDAVLEVEKIEAEWALRRKHNLEMKALRAKECEEQWRERCAQDMSEDSWASGWKQPIVAEEAYGGWEYAAIHEGGSSVGLAQYPSWKRKLNAAQLARDYGGWDQGVGLSEKDTPLGGWLYPDPSEPMDDYQTEVEILGKKVMVTVACKGATVESWLEGRKEAVRWGLDIEWRPTFQKGDYHYAALLQLSLEECCLLVQLQFVDALPASLKRLLADPRVMMGGVGILADTKKLKNDYDLICAGQVELTTLAVSTLKNTSLKRSGIATLTEKVLGIPYKKNKRATMSNWENRDLTYPQIQYAAADAWLSYSILMALLDHKEMPRPTVKLPETPCKEAADDGR